MLVVDTAPHHRYRRRWEILERNERTLDGSALTLGGAYGVMIRGSLGVRIPYSQVAIRDLGAPSRFNHIG